MELRVFETKEAMGGAAAACAAEGLRRALQARGRAGLIVATGTSQFEMLSSLTEQALDWSRVTAFHLDEYIGLSDTHPASFRRYLRERFVEHLPDLGAFHWVRGDAPDVAAECRRLGKLIRQTGIDVACVGIGENGHLAFNDPPADFETDEPYIVVALDEACQHQQLGEGWFPTLGDVPREAISMSIRQIMASSRIVCTVPDARKAKALAAALEGEVTNRVPASILQRHDDCHMFADEAAASQLTQRP
jgi:glucosamine-6-phosphate deaminase